MKNNFTTVCKIKNLVTDFVRKESLKNHYPTRHEIEEKFHINIRPPYFEGIKDVYKQAGVEYIRDSNFFLRLIKEEKLTKICVKLFQKLGYDIYEVSILSNKSGPDLVVIDKDGNLIPIEIKAYHKYTKIEYRKSPKYHQFGNEIFQLQNYIKEMQAPFGIIVTSTDRIFAKELPENVKILCGKDLEISLNKFKMRKELKELNWIRDKYVSYSKDNLFRLMKKKILEYVKDNIKKGRYVSSHEIEKAFKISLRTYFKSIKELYESIKVNPFSFSHTRMGGKVDKNFMKEKILNHFKKEVSKGRIPTYKEIQREFQCLLKSYFPGGIREILKMLNIPYQRKFAKKTEQEKRKIREKIIKFVKEKTKKGHYPTWREIERKFNIGILNYFNNIQDIYKRCDINLESRKD